MSATRPPIPEAVARQVRQQCGFGCVICGIPVYQYDHMEEWHIVQKHEAANITLLCGTHHDLKNRNQLPTEYIRKCNDHPHNKARTETSSHSLFYFGSRAVLVAGGNRVDASHSGASAIKIDGHSLIDFELVDGNLMLNVDLRDREGRPILTVRRNELTHSTDQWDYTFEGQTLSIREGRGIISLVIAFNPGQGEVVIEKGLVSHNGIEVWFDPRGICILNNCTLLSGTVMTGINTAISLGDPTENEGPTGIQIELDRSPFDRDAAIKWAREKLRDGSSPPTRQAPVAALPRTGTPLAGQSLTWVVCLLPLRLTDARNNCLL